MFGRFPVDTVRVMVTKDVCSATECALVDLLANATAGGYTKKEKEEVNKRTANAAIP